MNCLNCNINNISCKGLCVKCYNTAYRKLNREKILSKKREYRQSNKEKILKYNREYVNNNQDKDREWKLKSYLLKKDENNLKLKQRKLNDINFKIRCNLRSRLSAAVKRIAKGGSAIKDLGCSIKELNKYLESLFQQGMSWDNYGRNGWHIDHIKPLSLFDLTNSEEVKLACHYTNLQPLWEADNIRKSNYSMNEWGKTE